MAETMEKVDKSEVAEGTRSGPYFEPPVDIYETNEALTIVAEMPGVSEKDVEIDLRDGTLTLLGTMVAREPAGEPVLTEFRPGNYLRRFTLTDTIDQAKISAGMKAGLLTVTLPKVERAKPRKIVVQA